MVYRRFESCRFSQSHSLRGKKVTPSWIGKSRPQHIDCILAVGSLGEIADCNPALSGSNPAAVFAAVA